MSFTEDSCPNKQEANIYYLTRILAKLCTKMNLEIVAGH